MNDQTVTYKKEVILELLRDLEVLVVSTDRIGSAWHDCESDEQYNAMFVRFFDDLGFFRKLARARRTLSDGFSDEIGEDGMDELERNFVDLEFWDPPK